jgi:hypothetical protein
MSATKVMKLQRPSPTNRQIRQPEQPHVLTMAREFRDRRSIVPLYPHSIKDLVSARPQRVGFDTVIMSGFPQTGSPFAQRRFSKPHVPRRIGEFQFNPDPGDRRSKSPKYAEVVVYTTPGSGHRLEILMDRTDARVPSVVFQKHSPTGFSEPIPHPRWPGGLSDLLPCAA